MKVLKKGRDQKGWSKEAKCTGRGNGGGGCEAELLVEQGDLYRTESNHRDETDKFVTFICSECGVLTDIDGYPPESVNDLPFLSPRQARQGRQES